MVRLISYLCLALLMACSEDLPLEGENRYFCAVDNAQFDTAVILVIGQSNAANFGNQLYVPNCENMSNFDLGNFYELKDPLHGSDGAGGSVWSRMADQLLEKDFAKHIIVAPVARGGTAIEQWVPGGNLNYLLTNQIQALQNEPLKVTHVLWHQGESNNSALSPGADPIQNAEAYSTNFILLTRYIRSLGIDAPIFIAAATRCAWIPIDPFLQNAQIALANDALGVFNGPNTDLLGFEWRYDDCHFNREGLNQHALMWAGILIEH
ncbi:MAG: hypothetical protein ACI9O4_001856 [Chitinophagales bacterium]|jgi:hypothetical protein